MPTEGHEHGRDQSVSQPLTVAGIGIGVATDMNAPNERPTTSGSFGSSPATAYL
jgi:hypothetical protein